MPKRIDTQILVPAIRGGYIDIERFRHREWTPALRAAGVDHRRIYDCRHTFATWAIESGVHLWHLAGTLGEQTSRSGGAMADLEHEEWPEEWPDDIVDQVFAESANSA